MSHQNISIMPALLKGLRTGRGQSQKALALSLQIDQSRLCALERGRAGGLDQELLGRLRSALSLSDEEVRRLQWAVDHDHLVATLQKTHLSQAQSVVSEVLRAAALLSAEELAGLEREIQSITRSKRRLRLLASSATHADP
jgi:transcriptional regulator with XRE-family HTH domain